MADEKPKMRDPELERAKAWWQAHGKPIVAGLGIGLAGVVGFNFWQYHQETQAEQASVLFEELRAVQAEARADEEIDAADDEDEDAEASDESADADGGDESDADDEIDAETAAEIVRLTDSLMNEYADTPYAANAALARAKYEVEDGSLDEAARVLQWVMDNAEDEAFLHVARLRLAAVKLAQDDADGALALLNVQQMSGFESRYFELQGDAHLQKDDKEAARAAYQRGLSSPVPAPAEHVLLRLKLDDLGV